MKTIIITIAALLLTACGGAVSTVQPSTTTGTATQAATSATPTAAERTTAQQNFVDDMRKAFGTGGSQEKTISRRLYAFVTDDVLIQLQKIGCSAEAAKADGQEWPMSGSGSFDAKAQKVLTKAGVPETPAMSLRLWAYMDTSLSEMCD